MRKNNLESSEKKKAGGYRLRTAMVAGFLSLWAVAAMGKMFQLVILGDSRLEEYSEKLHFGNLNIHLPRGFIYDRNLNELAVSIDMNSAYLNPRLLDNPARTVRRLSELLEPEDGQAQKALSRKLMGVISKRKDKNFVWVRRKMEPDMYEKVKKEDIQGVGFIKESKRFYPKRDMAAKIIGFCGVDNQGLYGVEYGYDQVIRPTNSRFLVLKDALGRPISMPDAIAITEKSAPADLVLTIDERIQYITEKALERQVLKSQAKSGVAIVMDPFTGEILASAEQPRFNPNMYNRYAADLMKPQAVAHAVEPGSTFKLFVAAAAIEEKLLTPDEVIDCENGHYTVGGHEFKEAHKNRYGAMTVSEIIAKSSNIGAMKIGERLGPRTLNKYIRSFGFGGKTEVDLPGEIPGLLRPVSDWSATSLPSISFGQEISVTPVQLAAGIAAFANGGYLVRPHFVRAWLRNGEVIKVAGREVVGKPISAATARLMTEMMTGVVEHGTGEKAAIPGYTVAGKTGTAQKIDPVTRSYSADRHLASFAGFFPADAPRLVILVMIDEPKGVEWGGAVAGPVFSEIGARAARALRIPAAGSDLYEIDWEKMKRRNWDGQEGEMNAGATASAGEKS
ncbi:MAG: penicillin-binding protein 2 [Nitrospinae bacterium]|nr:penicillin-binding protein 2 [Nitrospinota bacterium]